MDADGDFVITWASFGQDGSGNGIYAQRYSKTGAQRGGEFRVNKMTANSQGLPAIAMDADGDFVIAWVSANSAGTVSDIHAQRFTANGRRLGREFRVNTPLGTVQAFPRVAMDDTGDFVITWTNLDEVAPSIDVYGQRFNASGVGQGTEFKVNEDLIPVLPSQDVAMDANGDFVITWAATEDDWDVYARRYNANGVPQGSRLRVNTTTGEDQFSPRVAMDSRGNFVVTWMTLDREAGGSESAVLAARRFSSDGFPLDGEFFAIRTGFGSFITDVVFPGGIAMNASGRFVVTNMHGPADFFLGTGILARQFTAGGAAVNDQFPVESRPSRFVIDSTAASDRNGNYVVAWSEVNLRDSSLSVYARRYSGSGRAIGKRVLVASNIENYVFWGWWIYWSANYVDIRVTMASDGRFVVAWKKPAIKDDGDIDHMELYARRFDGQGNADGDVFLVANDPVNPYFLREHFLATDETGSVIFAWPQYRRDNEDKIDLIAALYDASGAVTEFNVSALVYDSHRHEHRFPRIAMAKDGAFAVAWEHFYNGIGGIGFDPGTRAVTVRRYSPEGTELGEEIVVSRLDDEHDVTGSVQPDIAVAEDGRFVVVWRSDGGVHGQRFDASGERAGAEFLIDSIKGAPTITMASDGGFWVSGVTEAEAGDLMIQRFNSNGKKVGDAVPVNSSLSEVNSDNLTIGPNGDFAITGSRENSLGLYAQAFGAFRPVLLDDGVLRIRGTKFADTITINQFTPSGDSAHLQVTRNGVIYTFDPLQVSRIVVDGLAGNDSLQLSNTVSIPATLNGGSGNDRMKGGSRNDTFNGNVGNDTYLFDTDRPMGNDRIVDSGGIDTLDFSATTTRPVVVNLGKAAAQVVNANLKLTLPGTRVLENAVGGAKNDTLTGNSLANRLTGNAGNDTITGNAGNDILDGGSGSDKLYGNGGNDRLTGGPGSDTLSGGINNDTYVLGRATSAEADVVNEAVNAGIDTLNFSVLTTSVTVNLGMATKQSVHTKRTVKLSGNNRIENAIGGSASDKLTGNKLANRLTGNGGKDTLIGNLGNDVLDGGAGSDTLNGGPNNDTYVFGRATSAEADVVNEAPNAGRDTLNFSALTTSVTVNLASATLQTVHTRRTVKLNGSDRVESVIGSAAGDKLTGNRLANTLTGGRGNDLLNGGLGNDVLNGSAGNDTLNGGPGNDTLNGGANNDTYVFRGASTAEKDFVGETRNSGFDTVSFSALRRDVTVNLGLTTAQTVHKNRTVKLSGADRIERVVGGSGNDTLTGNKLANTLIGGAGNDMLIGGGGNDNYFFGRATSAEADQVYEALNAGTDTLNFAGVTMTSVTVNLGSANTQAVHINRTVKLSGTDRIENVIGGSGNDSLTGNKLANVLTGGAGSDILRGGAKNDTYIFGPASSAEADVVNEAVNSGIDTLDFSALTTAVIVNLGSTASQTVHLNRTLKLSGTNRIEKVIGGSGNDILIGNVLNNTLIGSGGNDVLTGNGGKDALNGNAGRDILSGGYGLDRLSGGDGEDILIAGRTTSDGSITKLNNLRTEWIMPTSYAARVANLRAGVGTPKTSLKTTVNVLDDAGEEDSLTGSSGRDWYFKAVDEVITGLLTSELVDLL